MFLTHLDTRALIDRPDYWLVIAPLIWKNAQRTITITVPAGFETNLASIPRPFRNIININGRSRRAAVLHDWLYSGQSCSRQEADQLFLAAMEVDSVNWLERRSMYLAVRAVGWVRYNQCANTHEHTG